MGIKYIWDTNTVIYYLQNQFSSTAEKLMDEIVENYIPAISVITEIELLCWKSASAKDIALLKSFIENSVVYELDKDVKIETISIRKNLGTKLPDAVIAATALVNNLALITRNYQDFKKMSTIELLNPFEV